jgi:hypothetical protein
VNRSSSSAPGLTTSHAAAPLPVAERGERKSYQPVEAAGAAKINRRSIMNMMVSAAALTATSATLDPVSAKNDDGEVLSLASEILRLNELAHLDDDEMIRLQSIWYDEGIRLRNDAKYTPQEQWEMVKAMPESAEHTRLVKKADPYFESADRLMKRLWPLPAKTNEGKAAKVQVLFAYVLGEEWHRTDDDVDSDVELTRQLLFELAGTSGSEVIGDHITETAATPSSAAVLWAERQTYVVENNALGKAYRTAYDQLPAWAKPGPRLIAHDGTYCGDEVGWPLDLNVTPSEHQSAYRVCRVSPSDIKKHFEFSAGMFPGSPAVRSRSRATMRASLRKVIARVREQRAEKDRLGLYENERQSLVLSKKQWRVEEAIQSERSADAKAAGIMIALQDNCLLESSAEDDSEMELACVALELLFPQLTGLIQEHVAFFLGNRTARLRDMPFATT